MVSQIGFGETEISVSERNNIIFKGLTQLDDCKERVIGKDIIIERYKVSNSILRMQFNSSENLNIELAKKLNDANDKNHSLKKNRLAYALVGIVAGAVLINVIK